MDIFIDFAQYTYVPRDRDLFADGGWKSWFHQYPQLFDEDDARILTTQARMRNGRRNKFFECLAAINLFEEYGYLSLLEKYATKTNHFRKKEVVRLLNSSALDRAVNYLLPFRSSGPDLLVYTSDFKEWFFVEAKSPTDRVYPNQLHKFERIVELTSMQIRLINFTPVS